MYGRRSSAHTGQFLTLCAVMLLLAMLSEQSWAAGARGAAKSALAPLESVMTQAGRNLDRVTSVLGGGRPRRRQERARAARVGDDASRSQPGSGHVSPGGHLRSAR